MFVSICGLIILIICLVALNTELVFLEALKKWFVHLSSKMTFSAKNLKLMKICLLHCKKLLFLSICGLSILIICLVTLNTELVFLEALKKWFCAFKLLNDFFCKKAQTHENLSSALQKTVIFEHLWPQHSHNLLSYTKHRIGVLRSSKEVILCI